MSLLAGNASTQSTGYGGDGQLGSSATLNNPYVLAVDAVGNVYFPDRGNDVIREISAQTGIITTIAGVQPPGGHAQSGCSDGVAAAGNPIGSSILGIAVDASGNIYFSDTTTGTISVIYRGGSQVANLIKLENPGGVTKAGGVLPGYVYHIAGTVNLSTCAGTRSTAGSATAAAVLANDGNLAFQSSTLGTVGPLALDSAGNLYLGDVNPNNTIRVINTQSTTQTFFGVQVQPGYIASIANCGALTTNCPPNYGANPATLANTGIGGPPTAAVFNTLANGAGQWMNVDAYGNLYELNTRNATPSINLGVAYAGGAGNTLGNLINNANLADTFVIGASGLTAQPGAFYYLLQSITLRPSSIAADPAGNLYYQDNHYGETYRIDVNARPNASNFLGIMNPSVGMFGTNRTNTVSAGGSVFCYPINASTTTIAVAGYKTNDQWGDGCPGSYAEGPGSLAGVSGFGSTITDGPGNLFLADEKNNLIREVSLNNLFPVTPVGQQWNPTTLVGEQELQFHFDQNNLPVQVTPTPFYTTSSFAIAPGISDFSINPISSNFTVTTSGGPSSGIVLGPTTYSQAVGAPGITSAPICGNETSFADSSLDCVVNVIFSPKAPGLRQSQLVVTTQNGSVYHFGLTGVGQGGQLAIDGGAATALAATGLGNPGQVAVTQSGTVYIADPTNNRVVVLPAGGAQTTVGTGLKSPMGVAVDASGNVYITDTGNNRVVKVPVDGGGSQVTLGGIVATGSPAYVGYTFNSPQGVAVDARGNVYVADTGNGKVVEIPVHPALGGATPLLQYAGAPALVSPVAVTVDSSGNIFVADPGLFQILEIPAGGGDAQTLIANGPGLKGFQAHAAAVGVYRAPSGVAVDAAGNLYVSDSSSNTVFMQPAGTGPGGSTVTLNFTGLNLAGTAPAVNSFKGGSIAMDANGNLYLADSGNNRVLFSNRQNPTVAYGLVAQGQPATTTTFSLTNIGNKNLTLTTPFTTVSATPSGNTAFTASDTCVSAGTTLAPGIHCTVTTSFLPTANGAQSAVVAVNGGASSISLTGTGEQPLAGITLSATTPTAGSSTTITATLSPQSGSQVPTGTVSFSYTVNGTSAGSATVVALQSTGSSATATLTIPNLLQGRSYVISAVYQGDASFSPTTATPLTVYVPGIPVTATATSVTYTYGQAVPKINGTVTGINAADNVTYTFTTAATPTSPVGVYPIQVVFSGGNYLNYGSPTVLTSAGAPATVTELKAPLTLTANNATTLYGAVDISPTSTLSGGVNNDPFAESYTPAYSSILNVGTYPLVPTLLGSAAVNYNVTAVNGTLTVTAAPAVITSTFTTPTVLPTALANDPLFIQVATGVSVGKGTPSGTITVIDTFTPIIVTAPGTGPAAAPVVLGPFPLNKGTYSYTATSQTPGTHVYAIAYSGDGNFLPTLTGTITSGSATLTNVSRTGDVAVGQTISGPGIPPSTTVASIGSGTITMSQAGTVTLASIPIGTLNAPLATASLTVDTADFTVSSTTNPIQIAPGVLPGGNNAISGEAASTPEQATVTLTSLLSYNTTVYLACQPQNPSYVTCTIAPTAVTLPANGTAVSILSIQTPATLPLGFFTSELRHPVSSTVLAFLPVGVLAFCFRRRKRLARVLWMLLAIGAISTGLNGCGGTSVAFFTPVPAGPQTVTIYACSVQASCTTADAVKSPLNGTGAGLIRSFTVNISIQ
ncbi:MAG: Ig-like domain repeat protein [Acidobacteriota bacterium]|nr:Ig-like domain repeat protein [Acidobacteriota bacterium]